MKTAPTAPITAGDAFAGYLGAEPLPPSPSTAGPYNLLAHAPRKFAAAALGMRLADHAATGAIVLHVSGGSTLPFQCAAVADGDRCALVCHPDFPGLPALAAAADLVIWHRCQAPAEPPRIHRAEEVLPMFRAAIRNAIAAGPANPFWNTIANGAILFSPEVRA